MKCPFPARHRGNSPYRLGAEGHTGTVLSSPDVQGAGCSREDNPTAWMWQDNVHPVPPTAMTQRVFGPGFRGGHRALLWKVPALGCETALEEGPQREQAGTQRSAKLTISGISHLQALTRQQFSSRRDSFPVKVPNYNPKAKKPLHGSESQRDQPGDSHRLRRARGKGRLDCQSSSARSQPTARGGSAAPGGLASTTGAERRRDFCSSARQELQRLLRAVAVTAAHARTTAAKASRASAEVKAA